MWLVPAVALAASGHTSTYFSRVLLNFNLSMNDQILRSSRPVRKATACSTNYFCGLSQPLRPTPNTHIFPSHPLRAKAEHSPEAGIDGTMSSAILKASFSANHTEYSVDRQPASSFSQHHC